MNTDRLMESNRLRLRHSTFEDCTLFARWETQPAIRTGFTMNDDWDYNRIAPQFVLHSQDPARLQLTILHKESGQAIGRVQISRIDEAYDSLDITRIYIGDLNYRRQGLGEEAMRLLLEYCFIRLHMERVTLDYIDGNEAARALYDKLGFQREGLARHGGKRNGRYVDFHLLSLLRSEYYSLFKGEEL